jgi:hypothetical protein
MNSSYGVLKHYEVMQCIGLINYIPYYEGDIVECKWKVDHKGVVHIYEKTYVIKYDCKYFSFCLYDEINDEYEPIEPSYSYEILGNIHENYELVEEMRNESYA